MTTPMRALVKGLTVLKARGTSRRCRARARRAATQGAGGMPAASGAGCQGQEEMLMPLPNRCEICGEPAARAIEMCAPCIKSHVNAGFGSPPMGGYAQQAILWAARRARWYAERKAARLARARKPTRRS